MSGSFWRFGSGYNDVSTISNLLENGFKEKDPKKYGHKQQRNQSISSSESEDSFYNNNDDTIDDDDDEGSFAPNLEILDDLLDEQDLLEELAGSNMKLIEYLRHREVLGRLIEYIITEDDPINVDDEKVIKDDDDNDDNQSEKSTSNHDKSFLSDSDSEDANQFDQKETVREIRQRRAQVSAEILSADAWSLTDSFMDNNDLLGKLWDILDSGEELSMVLSTYFTKINEHLLVMKIDEMLNFLLHQSNLVDRFLKHIDNPPLMDFLLKVISTDKSDNPTGIIDLLKEQDLISKLIDFLDPKVNSSIQSAAGDFIKAFVTISANSNADNSTIGPNELTRQLVSEPMIIKLADLMLNGGTSLSNGVGIIIEIIRKNNSDYDFVPVLFITIGSHPPTSRDPIYLGHLIKVFSKKIVAFSKLLHETKLPDLETPFGSIEPLGFERFKICELIAELLHCSNMGLLNDESGEGIVHERDIERERVIALEKQENSNEENDENELDVEASRDINRLSISSTETLPTPHSEREDENDILKDGGDENDDQTPEPKDIKEEEEDTDKEEEESQKILESEPDSDDVDATLDIEYDEGETLLRKQAIVGDQLKIALADNSVILIILKMFFRFPWNNFLHNVVFDIVQQILNGSMEIGYNKYLAIDLFGRGQITKLIIDGQQRCEDYQLESGLRLGYMGHLTLIAEEVVKFTALYPPNTIHQIVLEAVSTDEWSHYVTETLVETREKYNALLGGGVEDEEEEEEEDKTGDHIKPKSLVFDPSVDHDIAGSGYEERNDDQEGDDEDDNKFTRYISQQLTSSLPDKFGSSDEDEDEDDLVGWNNQHYDIHSFQDDDDDYEDPNDDGQSYAKKDHPLYSKMLSPTNETPSFIGDDDDDDEDNDSSDEENDLNNEGDDREGENGYGLTRSTSRGEPDWDDEEEEEKRFKILANYIKSHPPHPSESSD